jgi:LuxR family maltose regulon positive regulatory protein
MTTPLLTTKLYIPPPRPNLVPRPGLIERLDDGTVSGCKLTLISAPPGFGKTTLVTEWLGGVDRLRTWLSLDENDNDPARFFTYLVAALQRIDPSIGQNAQAMLRSPQPPPPELLFTSLINDIAGISQPFIFVLDDYHLIHTLPIHEQLAFLLEHQPPQLHLVLATREDPPLPLSRLRARGQIVEVRQAELRFTAEETAEFLRWTMQLELSSSDVIALHQRTEGWIAGLQLAACSLQKSDNAQQLVKSFAGSHRHILDYLIEEVFQQQPTHVQDFLLKTSILDRLTAPLCDAVTARDDGHGVLLALEQANLFIVPLDESRQWYRYHRLFADLLCHRLKMEVAPSTLASLHQRASQWCEAEGYLADAVHHSLAASDWERAATLIPLVSTDLMQRGEVTTLLGWFQALPGEVMRARPPLCLEYSWPLILTEQIDTAQSYLAQAEQAAQGDGSLLGAIAAAQAYIARVRGDRQRVIELSERALLLLPRDDWSGRSAVAVNLGIAEWYGGRLRKAEQALTEAQRAAQRSGNDYVRLTALVFLTRIQAARGRVRQAVASYRRVIQSGGRVPIVALAHIDLAKLLFEWDDLESAVDHVRQGLELSQCSGGVEIQAAGYVTLAFLKQSQGERAAAQEALQEGSQLLEHSGLSPSARWHALAYRVLGALAGGDQVTASHWVKQFPQLEDVETMPDRLLLMLARARLLLAQDRRVAAAQQLEVRYGMASRAGWQSALLETRALQALAAPTPEEALAFLAEALTLAEPEGYVRTFVDAGEPMAELLRRAASQGIAPDYVGKLLAAFEEGVRPSSRLSRYSGRVRGASSPSSQLRSGLVEPLSERELEVLQLLVEGQTYQEIAQALCVSVNTIKTHLKNIYGKLGVGNRREATAQAKKLGLVA